MGGTGSLPVPPTPPQAWLSSCVTVAAGDQTQLPGAPALPPTRSDTQVTETRRKELV